MCCAQEPKTCTVDDFERLSDMDFALMVWRQNLKRNLVLVPSRQVRDRSRYLYFVFCMKSGVSAFIAGATMDN